MDIILTEKQFMEINNSATSKSSIRSIVEKWEKISQNERIFVLEYIKAINPDKDAELTSVIKKVKKNNLNEAWYNTLLDVVGWIDPTGLADALNGILYIKNGDYLFGFLSFVGAVPYIGDVLAKPVMYSLKIGAPSAKALNNVMKLSKAGKSAEAAKRLTELTTRSKIANTFVRGFSKVADKLEVFIKNTPGGPLQGFKNVLLEWINLFKNAKKTGSMGLATGRRLAKNLATKTTTEQLTLLKNFKKAVSSGPFTTYRTQSGPFSWKTFWRGMPQLMGRNASVRALMRKSKWYLGLLDFMGIGNFVGPDELKDKLGDAKYEKAIEDYNKTSEASDYAREDFGDQGIDAESFSSNASPSSSDTEPSSKTSSSDLADPILTLLRLL